MIKPVCPHCQIPLSRRTNKGVFQYCCSSCLGFSVHLGGLGKILEPKDVSALWLSSEHANDGNILCSHCHHPMKVMIHGDGSSAVELDLCRRCQLVWLDTGEWQDLKTQTGAEQKREGKALAPGVSYREYAESLLKVEREKTQSLIERVDAPSVLKAAAAILSLPVEKEEALLASQPWMTWSLIGLCTLVSAAALLLDQTGEWTLNHLAFFTRHSFVGVAVTGFTSFFVHGSWWHLFANMYALWVFGDNVEDHLGKTKFLGLVFSATLAGHLAFVLLDPRATEIPTLGASGGIFGLIAYYLLRFPYRRFIVFFFFRFFALPAWIFGIFYIFLSQLVGVFFQVSHSSQVSYLDHFGGAAVGLLFLLLTRTETPRANQVGLSHSEAISIDPRNSRTRRK